MQMSKNVNNDVSMNPPINQGPPGPKQLGHAASERHDVFDKALILKECKVIMKGVCFVNASSTNLKYVTEAVCSSFVFSSVILFSVL